ncbi:NRDE family protein [Runella salmonicolor]|uniref:NRDE family protein n=1 Tax=Runella salmonicolor TaxID=2950278 RepID=A0ABT1FI63_9BACT|nr:NRDE family protein [Runella salmonicolor]MCP1381460.1 NRDE family protein [Runella salmonicolor]
MCFVTYIPHQQGFILTSNRDESVGRPKALPPKKYLIDSTPVFYPQDGLAGGTWIAASPKATVCLLNGAFVIHHHKPPYRMSRGKVVLDFFTYAHLADFVSQYDFTGIEPFTLVVVEEGSEPALSELRWDGAQLHLKALNAGQSYAWSSVTLYSDAVVRERERWWQDWQQQHPIFEAKDVLEFHNLGGNGDKANDLVMNRNGQLRTVSTTQIQKTPTQFLMNYRDRLSGHHFKYRIFEAEKISCL